MANLAIWTRRANGMALCASWLTNRRTLDWVRCRWWLNVRRSLISLCRITIWWASRLWCCCPAHPVHCSNSWPCWRQMCGCAFWLRTSSPAFWCGSSIAGARTATRIIARNTLMTTRSANLISKNVCGSAWRRWHHKAAEKHQKVSSFDSNEFLIQFNFFFILYVADLSGRLVAATWWLFG